jgi:hypothetical protein
MSLLDERLLQIWMNTRMRGDRGGRRRKGCTVWEFWHGATHRAALGPCSRPVFDAIAELSGGSSRRRRALGIRATAPCDAFGFDHYIASAPWAGGGREGSDAAWTVSPASCWPARKPPGRPVNRHLDLLM